jgi:hypothetical protein
MHLTILQSLSLDNVEISSAKNDIGASTQEKQTNVDSWDEVPINTLPD